MTENPTSKLNAVCFTMFVFEQLLATYTVLCKYVCSIGDKHFWHIQPSFKCSNMQRRLLQLRDHNMHQARLTWDSWKVTDMPGCCHSKPVDLWNVPYRLQKKKTFQRLEGKLWGFLIKLIFHDCLLGPFLSLSAMLHFNHLPESDVGLQWYQVRVFNHVCETWTCLSMWVEKRNSQCCSKEVYLSAFMLRQQCSITALNAAAIS